LLLVLYQGANQIGVSTGVITSLDPPVFVVSDKLRHRAALSVGTGVLEEHATAIIRIECFCNVGNYLPDHMF